MTSPRKTPDINSDLQLSDALEDLQKLLEKHPGLIEALQKARMQTSIQEYQQQKESLPERQQEFLQKLKSRFEMLSGQFSPTLRWIEVELSLMANPEEMEKLMTLNEKGHAINVFGEEETLGGMYILFGSGWTHWQNVSEDHRNIVFNRAAQKHLQKIDPENKCIGNAYDITRNLGVDLARWQIHNAVFHLVPIEGDAWIATDIETLKKGYATYMFDHAPPQGTEIPTHTYSAFMSFRAELLVKKVTEIDE